MLEDFLLYIEANLSINRKDKLLLAVSGGVDSMVMLDMFVKLNFNIEVAHINHSTRNGEAHQDMEFVQQRCAALEIPCHIKVLDYATLQQGNFQENARKERFAFLFGIAKKQHCPWIATAHHKDDRWETFVMHLHRKSGLRGLTSLRPKESAIIHPMLCFTKNQLLTYATSHQVTFVHDRSNDSDDYVRNAIRNHITPEVQNVFPNFIENANTSICLLEQSFNLLDELVQNGDYIRHDTHTGQDIIHLEEIREFKSALALLYHILSKYGFNYSAVKDILYAQNTGAIFKSDTHEALYDRGKLIVRAYRHRTTVFIKIEEPGKSSLPDSRKLKISYAKPTDDQQHLWIDANRVIWPLLVRNIRPGDTFKPLGMEGKTKSIKKLLTDLRINRFAKEDILVVCSEEKIIQVIGIRTAHAYQTSEIKNALTFKIVD